MTDSEFFSSVDEFVAFSCGDHAIKKILIANNGIGALKAIRSIRKWSFATFGNERSIKFVVMATPEDMRANAEYIRAADQVADVPGGTNNNNYANINLICHLAEQYKVDAVMPLWGHASENPALPNSLKTLKHRVTFIGPPAEPMHALGDKIGSTIIAQSAGVPTIAWNGDDIKIDYKKDGMRQEVYDLADVKTAEDAKSCVDRIGVPVMIKASEGGGGKGIRKVKDPKEVLNAYRAVQGEIPGSPIFVMKMASNARHLEVQLLADQHGEAIALSGRDCSVQRRHQKIIEEGPPVAASKQIFKRMEQAAVALAKTVGYCNAGTVEYLFMEETGEFAFLELNPRLQVEHPVTENILNVNLPACQLQVAMGLPLHRIADIRRLYGRHPRGRDTIDFEFAERVEWPHHCIAVRVTAENPDSGFQPTSGNIEELNFKSQVDTWGYFSVDHSGLVHEFADSQFGHIFAGGKDRESARRAMISALKEVQIRGDIHTTIEYIIKMMQSDDFVHNRINTDWLDGRIANHAELSKAEALLYSPKSTLVATCGAALQGYRHFMTRDADFVSMLKLGQVPTKEMLSPTVPIDLIFENVKYSTKCVQIGGEHVIVECNGQSQAVSVRKLADGGYMLNVAGNSHIAYCIDESDGTLRMILDGHKCLFTPEYDPTKLRSSVAGKLARLLVADGSHVDAGEPFVEIEVMKMYMPLKAQEPGLVFFQMSEGASLTPGDVIATVMLDNPDSVVTAETFAGKLIEEAIVEELEEMADTDTENLPIHTKVAAAQKKLEQVLEGYPLDVADIDEAMGTFLAGLKDPMLPALRVDAALSVLRGRIDQELMNTILQLNTDYKAAVADVLAKTANATPKFPAVEILKAIQAAFSATPLDKRAAFNTLTAELWTIVEMNVFSTDEIILAALAKFIQQYLEVEKQFDNFSFTDVVNKLRKELASDVDTLLLLCRSHVNVKTKNKLMLRIMEEIKAFPGYSSIKRPDIPLAIQIRNEPQTRNIKLRLAELAKLNESAYSHIAFSANLLLIDQLELTAENRRTRLNEAVVEALTTAEDVGGADRVTKMMKFVDSNVVIRDILLETLRRDKDYQVAVMEMYLRKIYQKTHDLHNTEAGCFADGSGQSNCWVKFQFNTKIVSAIKAGADSGSASYDDLASMASKSNKPADDLPSSPTNRPVVMGDRTGVIATVECFEQLPAMFPKIASLIPKDKHDKIVNAIHVLLVSSAGLSCDNEDTTAMQLSDFLSTHKDELNSRFVRRVTFFVGPAPDAPSSTMPIIYTFRSRMDFSEDRLFRHIEAPHAFHLDLPRLANFAITLEDGSQTSSGNVHLYRAVPKTGKGSRRFFARLVSFTGDIQSSDMESLFVEALDQISLVLGREETAAPKNAKPNKTAANHIFVNVVSPDTVAQPEFYEALLRRVCSKYSFKMMRLGVSTVELKLTCRLSLQTEPMFLRLVASNPTGFVLKIDKYYEASIDDGKTTVFKCISRASKGPWDSKDVQTPYEIAMEFESQRAAAMTASETLYVYDWPVLFEAAAEKQWCDFHQTRLKRDAVEPPLDLFQCKELVMCDAATGEPLGSSWTAKQAESSAVVLPMHRAAGRNDVGMVAWHAVVKTPECPEGRELVIICNDITFQAGSFGTREDMVFFKASEYARVRGLPRLFLTANSGARIGMAQSLKDKFQVCFVDSADPSKGFKYIYLTPAVHKELLDKAKGDPAAMPLVCSETEGPDGSTVYRIDDIIGEESDLGVENLMGSGLIAGETSRSYDEIFTLTLVVGRTVGIGAYLVRLGQRTIQKTRNAPIILTGYQALNKLMGREIYTTNDQLGGPMIMFPNGVSHLLADTHFDTVSKALEWMSFVPARKGLSLPVRLIDGVDIIDRPVQFAPQKGITYDPRLLFCGLKLSSATSTADEDSSWQSGFFDRDSFVEALSGWAKTVVVGRGRLGGIPLGVIVTENRTAEATKPADPADATSQEKLVQQAGGVWFPDSAYKTAQALRDFNREDLPCIIFANWRGFSGGQRDMFDEVLKFGSMIVDALVAYQQPLFVYIPPFAELRGGAWVVVDSTINADVMEFYAAEDARGGVLEAAGAASIKFREKDITLTAHRVDPVLCELDKKLQAASGSSSGVDEILKQIRLRERMLFGVYQQIAVHFADLHDTPGRMKAKGVIRQQVQWSESRRFFYWRLKRQMKVFELANAMMGDRCKVSGERKKTIAALKDFYLRSNSSSSGVSEQCWEDDQGVLSWLESNDAAVVKFVSTCKTQNCIAEIGSKLSEVVAAVSVAGGDGSAALKTALMSLPPDERAQILAALQ